jgi:hypothetical protein
MMLTYVPTRTYAPVGSMLNPDACAARRERDVSRESVGFARVALLDLSHGSIRQLECDCAPIRAAYPGRAKGT